MKPDPVVVHVTLEGFFAPGQLRDLDGLVSRNQRLATLLDEFASPWLKLSADEAEFAGDAPWWTLSVEPHSPRGLETSPLDWADALRRRIQEELRLSASMGIAGSRLAARIGSRMARPSGVLLWLPGYEDRLMGSVPLEELEELGAEQLANLRRGGLRTIGDMAELDSERARSLLGSEAARWVRLVRHQRGRSDGRPATRLERSLALVCRRLERRLRRAGAGARGLELQLVYRDGSSCERYSLFPAAAWRYRELYRSAERLFEQVTRHREPVVGLSLTATGLTPTRGQMFLFGAGRPREVVVQLGRSLDHSDHPDHLTAPNRLSILDDFQREVPP